MTITIGRVSITQNLSELEFDGDRLAVAGWFFGTSLDHAKVIREQLLGLDRNEDEPDIPVTYTHDSKIDGYYTVGSVNVSQIIGVSYERFKFQYALQLERVQGGFAAPICEVAASIALRTNAHSLTTAFGLIGVPSSATFKRGVYPGGVFTRPTSLAGFPRSSATGNLDMFLAQPQIASFGTYSFATTPSDHYDGAAMLEQSVGGVWYPVVGDQIGTVSGNLLRIGNGLVRMSFHTDGAITSELWDGAVWESSTAFELIGGTSGKWSAAGSWRVLKNSPAACTIQTSVTFAASLPSDIYYRAVTLHVERGKMLVEIGVDGLFYTTVVGSFAESMELQRAANVACTSITGGIRQTANDANGHRWLMVSPSAVTKDVTNGSILIAAPAAPLIGQFGLGWERDGSAATAINVATLVGADEYFAAIGAQQRVVAR